jgi:hypothetical protein
MAAPRSPGTTSRPNSREFGPLTSQQVGTAVLDSARKFWTVAEAEWRLKLDEARLITVRNGFATLAAGGHALPDDLAIRLANRFTTYREEEMFVFPGAHDAIDELKARGVKLALVTNGAAGTQRAKVDALRCRTASITSRSRANMVSASRTSTPICTPCRRSASPHPRPG